MEEYLKIIICPNHHISDDRQRMGKSTNIYFSFMLCQRNVLKCQAHPLLIPMAKCIHFDTKIPYKNVYVLTAKYDHKSKSNKAKKNENM